MNLNSRRFLKITAGVCGSVALSVVGSALWDVLKPAAASWGKALLTLITLGSIAVKDSVYREAAKGAHEEALSLIFVMVGLLWACGVLVFMSDLMLKVSRSERGWDRTKMHIPSEERAEELLRKLRILHRVARPLGIVSLMTTVLFVGTWSVQSLKFVQENNAFTFYKQSISICRPYIDERQAQMFDSRFAATKTRSDYIAIVADLRAIAQANQRTLPDFSPW